MASLLVDDARITETRYPLGMSRVTPALLLIALSPLAAHAQTFTGNSGGWARLNTGLNFTIDHALRTDIDGTNAGSVSVTRAQAAIDSNWKLADNLIGSLSASTEWTWYNFTNATTLVPGSSKPFSQLIDTTIRPGLLYRHNDQWSFIGGASMSFSGEADTDVGDAFLPGGFFGANYRVDKDFAWTFGIIAQSRHEDSVQFLPMIGLDWKVSETVSVLVTGPGVRIASKLNDRWTFVFDAAYQGRDYRLSDDAALPEGVVRDTRVPVSGGFIWSISEKADLTFKAGAVVYQEFELLNRTGVQVSETNTDLTPWVSIGGTVRF